MFLYDASQVREADRKAMEDLLVPGCILMENAARSAAEHIIRFHGKFSRVVIACGGGNNGGDGLALARQLLLHEIKPKILMATNQDNLAESTAEQLSILRRSGIHTENTEDLSDEAIMQILESAEVLIDGLLGTGARGAPRGEIERVISLFNSSRKPVTSLDVPSGVDASTGEVPGIATKALSTITFLAPKTGLFVMPGRAYSGHIATGHIGVLPSKIIPQETRTFLPDNDWAYSVLPQRDSFTHKGKRGTVLVFGGSRLYTGAPLLAARGALRAGAGIVVLVSPENAFFNPADYLPEAILCKAPSRDGFLLPEAYDCAMEQWGQKASAIVAGPGIGKSDATCGLVKRIWESAILPTCIDADALRCLADMGEALGKRANAILTPHEGEAAALAGKTPFEVASQRLQTAEILANRWGTVILKGAGTIIDSGSRRAVIGADHPCLSVPGSGDVLSGVIGAMLASGLDTFDAAVLAAFVHSKTGTLLGEEKGLDGLMATEIADGIPQCLKDVRNSGGNQPFRKIQ
ncbi:MAG: NAD(P)H-hydrate dehydratase [Thermovirgaceae bacterium]